MDGQKLVKMANQIAAAFGADPDRKVAVENTAGHLRRFWEPRMRREILAVLDRGGDHGHLRRFWEPRMRREILAVLDRGGDHGMSPIVVDALQQHRKALEPAAK